MPHQGVGCYICKKQSITIGSVVNAYSKKPKFICEDCTIDQYKRRKGFKTRKAAEARRRRIFDVIYLFQEMIVDKYLEYKGMKSADDLDIKEIEWIGQFSNEAYNQYFNPKEKIELEETYDQKEIEKKLKKVISKLKID